MKCNLTTPERRGYVAAGSGAILAGALLPAPVWLRAAVVALGVIVVLEGAAGY